MKVSFKEFDNIYQSKLNAIYSFYTPEMQKNIAKHNIPWGEPYSFKRYLEKSVKRFYIAYLNIPESVKTCCDIGGFWGIYSVVLKELGYEVVMTEALKFYDETFDNLFNHIKSEGVKIIDIDPFTDEMKDLSFDYISVMAVLEHIPHSISFFMNNIKGALSKDGGLYIEVPNIAYYKKRVGLLFGNSPLPKIEAIYKSATPFIGHHHEYSLPELKKIYELNDLKVINIEKYNYSMEYKLFKILVNPLAMLSYVFFPNTREVISALGVKK